MKKLALLAVLVGLVSSSTGCIVPLYDGPGRGDWRHVHHGGWGDRGDDGGWSDGRHHRHHDDD